MNLQEQVPQRIHKPKFAEGKSRLISVAEVSHRTGLGVSTIHHKVSAGQFVKPLKVKKGVTRWLESDIDQWIDDVIQANAKAS